MKDFAYIPLLMDKTVRVQTYQPTG